VYTGRGSLHARSCHDDKNQEVAGDADKEDDRAAVDPESCYIVDNQAQRPWSRTFKYVNKVSSCV
jgi:hypothetical protein